jgi:WD repeat-containing protein 35
MGGDDTQLVNAWNKIGQYYSDRHKWSKAAQFYAQVGGQYMQVPPTRPATLTVT